jgi:hypothetical protein
MLSHRLATCLSGLLLLVAAGAAQAAESGWTRPPQAADFAIQYQGKITEQTLSATVVDLDLFDTADKTIAAVKQRGGYLVCYLSAGSLENWRPDAKDYPAAIVGKPYEGWRGERWLDISRLDLLGPVLRARLDLAVRRGCDAVDPDNLDGYQTDTGFRLTRGDAVKLVGFLAAEGHARGLAVGLKNVPELVRDVADWVDFVVSEECARDHFCADYDPLLAAGRAVFNIHYGYKPRAFAKVCKTVDPRSTNVLKRLSLSAYAQSCP